MDKATASFPKVLHSELGIICSVGANVLLPDIQAGKLAIVERGAAGIILPKIQTAKVRNEVPVVIIPSFSISGVSFNCGKEAIQVSFTTSASAKCWLYLADADDGEPPDTLYLWWMNASLHGTSHTHSMDGLTEDHRYFIRIKAQDSGGNVAWKPSASGYYIVRTASETGGGGLEGTVE